MESDFFRLERDGAVAHLAMNRPDKANAMIRAFRADLPRIVAELDVTPEVRALVISAEGSHFTSGIDLSMFTDIGAMFAGEPVREQGHGRRGDGRRTGNEACGRGAAGRPTRAGRRNVP